MKIRASLHRTRTNEVRVVKRKGRVYVINRANPKLHNNE